MSDPTLANLREGPLSMNSLIFTALPSSGFLDPQSVIDRFGPAAVTIARFVPVVRTFAPVAAGVGKMPRRVFTMFNILGAV